jgi:serine O-acetyltransferase
VVMDLSLKPEDLRAYIGRLLGNHIPDQSKVQRIKTQDLYRSLERVEHCFSRIHRKYYAVDGCVYFNHLNSDHMASFLWFLSNEIWDSSGDDTLPTRLSYLNKIMHGVDLFYSVPMPGIFLLVHPVGTVIGRGTFGDYLVVYQQCTIGSSRNAYPTLGTEVLLYAGATVLGATQLGDNVVVGAGSLLVNAEVPTGTLVVGRHPTAKFLPLGLSVKNRCFDLSP